MSETLVQLEALFADERRRRIAAIQGGMRRLAGSKTPRARARLLDGLARDLHAVKGMAQIALREQFAATAARAEQRVQRLQGDILDGAALEGLRGDVDELATLVVEDGAPPQ